MLSEINVYTDPISNYVITYQLTGTKILDDLATTHQIININLSNVLRLNKIDTKQKKVYIFENPSILNSIYQKVDVPILITSGIPNLSLYKIIEKLLESNNQLYYNGDFDPEGLLIAEKLKKKYPTIELFCYQKEDYLTSKSNDKITLSRIKKMESIKSIELQEIKEILKQTQEPSYQEKNIDRILSIEKNNV